MNINVGKNLRMSEFIDTKDEHSLILDLTISSSVGAQPGLENTKAVLQRFNSLFDGIVLNPGQLEHHASLLGGKLRAAPLLRVDWTNAYRDKEFCLPAAEVNRVVLSDGEDAMVLGASAVVATLLLGYGEDLESENIRSISLLARECYRFSLPLIVDIRPIGDRISLDNYAGSVRLGTSLMMEAGADALMLPESDPDTLALIGKWATIPVLIRLDEIPSGEKARKILDSGARGFVLSEKAIVAAASEDAIMSMRQLVHAF